MWPNRRIRDRGIPYRWMSLHCTGRTMGGVYVHWSKQCWLLLLCVGLLWGQGIPLVAAQCGAMIASVTCATDDCGDNLEASCQQLECVANHGCDDMMLTDSQVYCSATSTCSYSVFTRSTVYCLGSIACGSSVFVDSVVHCDSGCSLTSFDACSCCSGNSCPQGVVSCDNLNGLCSRQVFAGGGTCADRNPLCAGHTPVPQRVPAPLGNGIHAAQCGAIEPSVCTTDDCGDNLEASCQQLECVANHGCDDMVLTDSQVYCHTTSTCSYSIFTRSIVYCLGSIACGSSVFVDSAVQCDSGCSLATFDACSCCSGNSCPRDVVSCDNLDGLCSRQVFSGGGTCADRNPLCAGHTPVPQRVPAPLGNGIRAAQCGAIEPIVCTTDDCGSNLEASCQQLECVANHGCDDMVLTDSQVYCHTTSTCSYSIFTRSIVYCLGSIACGSSVFVDSAVQCDSGCSLATFDACSCCSGNSCERDVVSCDNLDGLCSRQVFSGGGTCADRNPLCGGTTTTNQPVLVPVSVVNPTRSLTLFPTKAPIQMNDQSPEPVVFASPTVRQSVPTDSSNRFTTLRPTKPEAITSGFLSSNVAVGILSSFGVVMFILLFLVGVLIAKLFGWCCFKLSPKDSQDDLNRLADERGSDTDLVTSRNGAPRDDDSFLLLSGGTALPVEDGLLSQSSAVPPPTAVVTSKKIHYKHQVEPNRFRQQLNEQGGVANIHLDPPIVPVAVAVADTPRDP